MTYVSAAGSVLDRVNPALAVWARAHFGGSREPELTALGRFVKPGGTVVDVGAHRGLYTWHLSRLVGPSGSVHAFEPQPALLSYLHVAFYRRPQVVLHGEALSNATGTAVLRVPNRSGADVLGHATLEPASGRETKVVTVELDSLGLAPSFMKVDVEGHEAAVIAGARETIRKSRPVLLLEVDRRSAGREAQRRLLVEILAELGYGAWAITASGELQPFGTPALTTTAGQPFEGYFPYNFFFMPGARTATDETAPPAF
jgi:FkbM family methyltransferase